MDKKNKIIFLIVIIIFLFVIVSLLCSNKLIIDDFIGIRVLKIKSGSMYPILDINDFVFIVKSSNYENGDIITYDVDNKYLITHRIIEKKDKEFITKGDNNNSEDENIVKYENVKGKVIVIIKNRYLKIFIIIILIIIVINRVKKGTCNE